MSATRHFAPATRRHRAQNRRCRRHAPGRRLLCESLESRLLLSGDSWVVPTGMPCVDMNQSGGQREVGMDALGNVYVAATVDGGAETDQDLLVAKYSPNGVDIMWEHTFAVPGWQKSWGAEVATDGLYVAGQYTGTVDFDPSLNGEAILQVPMYSSDGFLVKYSLDGDFCWVRRIDDSPWEPEEWTYLTDVAVLERGEDVDVCFVGSQRKDETSTHVLAKVQGSDGQLCWTETMGDEGSNLAVYKPVGEPARIYAAGVSESRQGDLTYFVTEILESADGGDASVQWTTNLGANNGWSRARIAVGTEETVNGLVPRIYVPHSLAAGTSRLDKLDETGNIVWSQQATSSEGITFRDVAVYDSNVYLVGNFRGSANFDENSADPLVISRGDYDSFLVRYDTNDGHLRGAQRMGGSSADSLNGLAVTDGWILAAGSALPPDADFPASQPGQVSAFVPITTNELYVMRLDAAAPVVKIAETSVTILEGEPVTLTATATAGNIQWYDANVQLGSGSEITVTLDQGTHQISAIATDEAERIGKAGVVVKVALATKFYVVDECVPFISAPDLTYEYDASGNLVESYALSSNYAAPRGAASTTAGDKLWVVDANRNVYVYNTSGGLLGSWTAGTLNSKSVVEGVATNGTDVWIVDAKTDKVYKYTGAASRTSRSQNAASSFSLNSANTSPKDIVTDGTYLWVVNDSTTDKVFKYTTAGALVSSWTITTSGATSPTGITIDPSNVSDIWIVDSGTDRVYQYNNAATLPNGSSKAADTYFALAGSNTNPQGIADPPVLSSAWREVPEVVYQEDAAQMLFAAAWDTSVVLAAALSPLDTTAVLVPHRVPMTSRTVDELMSQWENVLEPDRPAAATLRATSSVARRATRTVDFEVLDTELDTQLGWMADDVASAHRWPERT